MFNSMHLEVMPSIGCIAWPVFTPDHDWMLQSKWGWKLHWALPFIPYISHWSSFLLKKINLTFFSNSTEMHVVIHNILSSHKCKGIIFPSGKHSSSLLMKDSSWTLYSPSISSIIYLLIGEFYIMPSGVDFNSVLLFC